MFQLSCRIAGRAVFPDDMESCSIGRLRELVPVSESKEQHLTRHGGGRKVCPRCRFYVHGGSLGAQAWDGDRNPTGWTMRLENFGWPSGRCVMVVLVRWGVLCVLAPSSMHLLAMRCVALAGLVV